MKNKKIYKLQKITVFCIMFGMMLFANLVYSDMNGQRVSLHLKSTTTGIPNKGLVYNAYNLNNVYQKIMYGDIANEETQTLEWRRIQKIAQEESDETTGSLIHFANGIAIGPGITHNPDDTLYTIKYLLRRGGLSLLTKLNGEGTENIFFHQPESWKMSNTFTNKQGQAVASVSPGITAIMTGGGVYQKLINVTEDNQEIDIDTANIDNRLSISLDNVQDSQKTNFGRYVVESGENLSFTLNINKEFSQKSSGTLKLSSSSNMEITSITEISGDSGIDTVQIDDKQLVSNPAHQISIPKLTENMSIRVTVRVIPQTVESGADTGAMLSVAGLDDSGIPVSAKSPAVVLSGINFAMLDTENNKLTTGGEYLLGKYDDQSYQLYSANEGWKKVSNLDNIDSSQFTLLKGGNQYDFGNPNAIPIAETLGRFNFNAEENKKLNQSLIQITGLAQGDHYFLYPVREATGYDLIEKPIDFAVFTKFDIGRNGNAIIRNSINQAVTQNFKVNSNIPDFKAGVNEYNVLSVNGMPQKPVNVGFKIILPIVLFCLLICIISIAVIKF